MIASPTGPEKTKCLTLETLCFCIAGINMIGRGTLFALGLLGGQETVYLMTLPDDPQQYRSMILILLRPLLMLDCVISMMFSVVLIVGVHKADYRLLRLCVIYGLAVFLLSALGTIPYIIKKLVLGDFNYMERWLLALMATVICGLELYVVYKMYRKFVDISERRRITGTQNKTIEPVISISDSDLWTES